MNRHWPMGSRPWSTWGFARKAIAGSLLLENDEVLSAIAAAIPQDGRYLELGTFSAATAAAIAELRPDVTVLAVDWFAHGTEHATWPPATLALANALTRANLSLLIATTEQVHSWLAPGWHVVMVDADHNELPALADLRTAAHLSSGSILVHDYGTAHWPGVTAAVDRFCRNDGWQITARCRSLAKLDRTI